MKRRERCRWRDFVWDRKALEGPAWRRRLIWSLRLVWALVDELAHGRSTLWAMGLVYTTLLSIVPLLAVGFSVLKGLGVHNQLLPALMALLSPLGGTGAEIGHRIVGFVENVDVGVLGAMGLAVLVVTVVALMEKIERAFNEVWRIDRIRPFVQRVSTYLSVVLIGPVLVFSALGVTASLWSDTLTQRLVAIEPLGAIVHALVGLLPYLLVTAAFGLVYVLMPNTRVRPGAALGGGIAAGILWELAGRAFAAIVAGSSSYTAIYSTFAILIVFMLWLHLSWLILLLGARVAYFIQHPAALGQYRQDRPSPGQRLALGLALMATIGRRRLEGIPPCDRDTLAETLAVPPDWIEEIARPLIRAGLLLTIDDDPPMLVPGRDLEDIPLAHLVSLLVGIADTTAPGDPAVADSLARLGAAIDAEFGTMDLRSWLSPPPSNPPADPLAADPA